MENNKIMFETPEQIKDYFVNLIKSGKKVKDEEIIKTCQSIDMSDEEMADLIDEILSIEDQDIDFTGEDEMNVDSMLLDDDIFVPTDEVDLIAAAEEDFEDLTKIVEDSGTKINDPVKMYLKEIGKVQLLGDREIELARRTKEGDIDAKNELISANLRLVVSIAKHFL